MQMIIDATGEFINGKPSSRLSGGTQWKEILENNQRNFSKRDLWYITSWFPQLRAFKYNSFHDGSHSINTVQPHLIAYFV